MDAKGGGKLGILGNYCHAQIVFGGSLGPSTSARVLQRLAAFFGCGEGPKQRTDASSLPPDYRHPYADLSDIRMQYI
jgi:hypothetical protein